MLLDPATVDRTNGLYAGIDVGGTNIVCGLIDAAGRLLGTVKRPTAGERGGDALVARIAEMVDELLAAHGGDRGALCAAGIGMPGFLDPHRGIVRFAANLNVRDYPLAARLRGKLGVPACIDNDVRMYMYGEAVCGAAAGYDHVLGVAIGTGMAGALVTRGELHYGARYLAGEIGHAVVEGNSYACGCGMIGCLETIVSAGGIVRQARDRMAAHKSVLADWFPAAGAYSAMTSADVAKACELGDPVAVAVFERTAQALGAALAVPAMLTSPDMIVIGGGVAQAGEHLLAPLREALKQRVHPLCGERMLIAQAQLGDDAGVIGAALAAKQRSEQLR